MDSALPVEKLRKRITANFCFAFLCCNLTMGVDIDTYRAKIGTFTIWSKLRKLSTKSKPYKSHHSGTDIHFRIFICCIFALFCFSTLYCVVRCRAHITDTYAATFIDPCIFQRSLSLGYHHNALHTSSVTVDRICSNYGGLYDSFSKRILMLSSDVEFNPGPESDTERILKAIMETKSEVTEVKSQVINVTSELQSLKTEMSVIHAKVNEVQSSQRRFEVRLHEVESKAEMLSYDNEVILDDVAGLSRRDEENQLRLDLIEQQLNIIESDRLKCSLRIFGLDETEVDENELKNRIDADILGVAEGDELFDENTVVSARRVGKVNENEPRLVIVKFKCADDKFKLLNYREKLRENGIRLSNDLSYIQRQQLKELKKRGYNGYFKAGRLIRVPKKSDDEIKTRVYRNAARRLTGNTNETADMAESMDTIPESQGDDTSSAIHVD